MIKSNVFIFGKDFKYQRTYLNIFLALWLLQALWTILPKFPPLISFTKISGHPLAMIFNFCSLLKSLFFTVSQLGIPSYSCFWLISFKEWIINDHKYKNFQRQIWKKKTASKIVSNGQIWKKALTNIPLNRMLILLHKRSVLNR